MSTPDPDLYSTRPPSTAPEYDLATQVDREARAADSTGDGFSNTESFAPPTQYATSTTDVAASTVAARASSSRPTIGLELSEAVG